MPNLNLKSVNKFVEDNIGVFHQKRLESLTKLKLKTVLRRKNPYLFRCKNILLAQDFVKVILDAHLSSQEETILGGFLEGVAVFACSKAYGGRKSSTEGIDLEFEKDGERYLVSIKSGPNWGNSSQIKKMRDNFRNARKVLGQGGKHGANIVAINGCCYGRDNKPHKGDYLKYCGQRFWELVTGDPDFYQKIIQPLGKKAKKRNEKFNKEYARIINKFTKEFSDEFCTDGNIDWGKLLRFNSSI